MTLWVSSRVVRYSLSDTDEAVTLNTPGGPVSATNITREAWSTPVEFVSQEFGGLIPGGALVSNTVTRIYPARVQQGDASTNWFASISHNVPAIIQVRYVPTGPHKAEVPLSYDLTKGDFLDDALSWKVIVGDAPDTDENGITYTEPSLVPITTPGSGSVTLQGFERKTVIIVGTTHKPTVTVTVLENSK